MCFSNLRLRKRILHFFLHTLTFLGSKAPIPKFGFFILIDTKSKCCMNTCTHLHVDFFKKKRKGYFRYLVTVMDLK